MRLGRTCCRSSGSLLLAIFLTATGAVAEPLLRPVDAFQGLPFGSPFGLAFTADGKFLYATTRTGFAALRRQADGESFRVLAFYDGGLPRLAPGDAHVYTAAGSTLTAFARDARTGLLTPVQTLTSGEMGLPDFIPFADAVFSPLGDHLYVSRGHREHRVVVFERDAATGRLSFVQEIAPLEPDHSLRLRALLTSPDGRNLYALGTPALTLYDRDPGSGRLTFVETLDALAGDPVSIVLTKTGAVSPDGEHLYLIGQNGCYNSCRRDGVATLGRDPASGRLELVATDADAVQDHGFAKLVLSPDGSHLYVADGPLEQPRISVFARLAGSGRLERRSEIVARRRPLPGSISALQFDPADGALVASGFEHRPLTRLRRDPASGALRLEARPDDPAEAIADARHLTLGPDGRHLYVTGFGGAVASFAWDDAAGALLPRQAVQLTDPGRGVLSAPIGFRQSPDGSRLYALSEWGPMVTLALDAAGGLEILGTFEPPSGAGAPRDLEISPDGAHLYFLGGSGIAVVSREATPPGEGSDAPAPVQVVDGDESYQAVALGPGGRHLYALVLLSCAAPLPCPAVAIFDRDPASGRLTRRQNVPRPGWTAFDGVVVSSDGAHVYASSRHQGTLVVEAYARNAADGSLALVEILDGDAPDPDDPYRYGELALAPDGRHLYATTEPGRGLAVFARDLATGRLTPLDAFTGDELPALAGASDVAVGPDSQLVFVIDPTRATLTTLSRRCLVEAGACAGGDRFRLDVAWRDFAGRTGVATPLEPVGDDSRIFWFFAESNWEMLVKVIDGCSFDDRFWVFAAATTNVEHTLAVTDTWTGRRRAYSNPLGRASPAVTDSDAFATCDAEPPADH